MTNPFEYEDGTYSVLVNDECQYSLWPTFLRRPEGWIAVGPPGDRRSCLAWIDANWTDMRPKSLTANIDSNATGGNQRQTDTRALPRG